MKVYVLTSALLLLLPSIAALPIGCDSRSVGNTDESPSCSHGRGAFRFATESSLEKRVPPGAIRKALSFASFRKKKTEEAPPPVPPAPKVQEALPKPKPPVPPAPKVQEALPKPKPLNLAKGAVTSQTADLQSDNLPSRPPPPSAPPEPPAAEAPIRALTSPSSSKSLRQKFQSDLKKTKPSRPAPPAVPKVVITKPPEEDEAAPGPSGV